jgi:choline dehydrogenase-like flavoprotein
MATSAGYDYIIVGGGTAGLVVANRLSEDPDVTVVVIEAGADQTADPRVTTPAMFQSMQGSELDWGYATLPQVWVLQSIPYFPT